MLDLGIKLEEFIASYYEKQPYFSSRGHAGKTKISWGEIDALMEVWDAADGSVIMYKNGRLPDNLYSERYQDIDVVRSRLLPDRVRAYLADGASLILNRLERRSVFFSNICLELSEFVNEKVVANGYIASGGEGTFGKHWDTHDVFIIQLQGRKHWKVYEPTYELPLPKQRSGGHKAQCPTDPVIDQILEEGDVLYLPRGWWHEAIPIPDQTTFHIAAGIHTTKVVDYFEWICLQILPHHLEFRHSLKVGENDRNASIVRDATNEIIDRLADPTTLMRYMEGIGSLRNRSHSPFFPYSNLNLTE